MTKRATLPETPPPLYKYCNSDVGLRIIRANKVRFTPPIEFNDPFDQNPSHAMSEEELRQMSEDRSKQDFAFTSPIEVPDKAYHRFMARQRKSNLEYAKARAQQIRPELPVQYQRFFSERFGVCCFTEHKSSLLMWAHYADEHKGCVLEFIISDPGYVALRWLRKVQYSKKRPVCKYGKEKDDVFDSLYHKGQDWSYEDEWRMFAEFKTLEKAEGKIGPVYLDTLPMGTITAMRGSCLIRPRESSLVPNVAGLLGVNPLNEVTGKRKAYGKS